MLVIRAFLMYATFYKSTPPKRTNSGGMTKRVETFLDIELRKLFNACFVIPPQGAQGKNESSNHNKATNDFYAVKKPLRFALENS